MLACTGNHEIEAQSDAADSMFKSVQARWKVNATGIGRVTLLVVGVPYATTHAMHCNLYMML